VVDEFSLRLINEMKSFFGTFLFFMNEMAPEVGLMCEKKNGSGETDDEHSPKESLIVATLTNQLLVVAVLLC